MFTDSSNTRNFAAEMLINGREMKVEYRRHWSSSLERDMEYKVYGSEGRGVLVFPSQDQRFYEWEDNGMVDVLAPMIDGGLIHLICCDSIDAETWSNGVNGAHVGYVSEEVKSRYHERIALHERWYSYIVEELIPEVSNGERLIVTGCSMRGYHAGSVFFRRPDLSDTMLSLSGLFNADYFFPQYDDELIYFNSPLDFLNGQHDPSVLLTQYRSKQIICCCGRGAYEGVTSASTRRLQQVLSAAGVDGWFDFWGEDVSHDFYWWRKQAAYFFDKIINKSVAVAA